MASPLTIYSKNKIYLKIVEISPTFYTRKISLLARKISLYAREISKISL
jgi:hypothetical protein